MAEDGSYYHEYNYDSEKCLFLQEAVRRPWRPARGLRPRCLVAIPGHPTPSEDHGQGSEFLVHKTKGNESFQGHGSFQATKYRGGKAGPRILSAPYGSRGGYYAKGRKNTPSHDGSAGSNSGGTNEQKWFRVDIPHGKKYDKVWLLERIQKHCMVPFTPVKFRYEKKKAVFYIQDTQVAKALIQASQKITDRDNYKVMIIVNHCVPPASAESELKSEPLEILKQCISKRFDGSQQALDLNSLCNDPDLFSQNIDMVLHRKKCMQDIIKIIEENMPELVSLDMSNNKLEKLDEMTNLLFRVPNLKILNLSRNELKTDRELDNLKGLKLEELWLDENPLCDYFWTKSVYISNIRDRFPKLLRLDGHDLPPPIFFDLESPSLLACKGSYFCSDDVKGLILHFLQQYYSVYDSDDRQDLLDIYHDEACCSLSIPFIPKANPRTTLPGYFNDKRNVKVLRDPEKRFKLLKYKRLNVVSFLNKLPRTQHDINSFVVDVSEQTDTLLCFTVHGIFKEVPSKAKDSLKAFSRVFVAVPAGSAGLSIVNDEIVVRMATGEEIRKAFVTPATPPSSSPVPTLSATQQEMLEAFSQQSGMNLEWSQKCLVDNNWDYNRAAQVFTLLKAEGKVPEMAFMK